MGIFIRPESEKNGDFENDLGIFKYSRWPERMLFEIQTRKTLKKKTFFY